MIDVLYSSKEIVDPVMFNYLNAGDMQLRLRNSTLRYKGELIVIEAITDARGAQYSELKTGARNEATYADLKANLSLENLKLGYCNNSKLYSYYIKRAPLRQGDQGIQLNQCFFQVKDNARNNKVLDYFSYKEIAKMFNNEYPNFEEAKKTINNRLQKGYDDKACIAFHKEYALFYDDEFERFNLYYKDNVVGTFKEDSNVFTLLKKWKFLKEDIEAKELGIKYAAS